MTMGSFMLNKALKNGLFIKLKYVSCGYRSTNSIYQRIQGKSTVNASLKSNNETASYDQHLTSMIGRTFMINKNECFEPINCSSTTNLYKLWQRPYCTRIIHLNKKFSPSRDNPSMLYLHTRFFSKQNTGGTTTKSKPFDPNQNSRRQTLTLFTYLSCFIGVCLLSVIGFQSYGKMKRSAVGMEDIKIREYGHRAHLFRYRGFVFPDFVVDDIRSVHEFPVREDDIWIASFPKAGTTWVQEIVYLINSDLDFAGAQSKTIDERCPYFEFISPGKKAISEISSPRLIKTHLPFSILPNAVKVKKPKIIYVMRNPKDTLLSFYHFATKFLAPVNTYWGDFDRYCELFTEDLVAYGPWWKHVLGAWKHRDDENVLFISYEDMHADLPSVVNKIADFLGKGLNSEQVEQIVHHCSFESMKKNKSTNYSWMKERGMAAADEGVDFMRRGKVGDWRNELSNEIVTKLDEVVSNKLIPAGLVVQDMVLSDSKEEAE